MKFLIVDDAEAVRLAVADAVRWLRPDAEVQAAADAATAIDLLRAFQPDVLVFDMAIEGPEAGLRVLEAAKKGAAVPRTVLVSGLTADDDRVVRALKAGVDAFVRKPVRVERLRRALDAVAEGRKHVDAAIEG